ncbi:MAG: 16S rRNA (guanine(527)-N(7))-methyltransferase RsmG [Clostridia bacterium]|nr:16S rRNA (guanine(527)-N(7))-methyltransferase RsmG [Clostridia bacterium]
MNEWEYRIDETFKRERIELNEKQVEQFRVYGEFLSAYNEKVNLTAIRDPQEVIDAHFVDSLAARHLPELVENAGCADVGTGAGFPGVPLAIARPDITVTLIDSLKKRLVFLDELKEKLRLDNIVTLHGRGEDLAHDTRYRERFDCVLSRAVARLNVLCELDVPFLRCGGRLLAWKGPAFAEEAEEAKHALKTLGASVETVYSEKMEMRSHFIVVIRKDKPTPSRYPRRAGTPKRSPL